VATLAPVVVIYPRISEFRQVLKCGDGVCVIAALRGVEASPEFFA